MEIKRLEFMDLKLGGKPVMEYAQVFNHLAQYALKEVSTDEKKQYRFVNGLTSKMQALPLGARVYRL